jgi:hypothetical protein
MRSEPALRQLIWEQEVAGSNPVAPRASLRANRRAIQQSKIWTKILVRAIKVPLKIRSTHSFRIDRERGAIDAPP